MNKSTYRDLCSEYRKEQDKALHWGHSQDFYRFESRVVAEHGDDMFRHLEEACNNSDGREYPETWFCAPAAHVEMVYRSPNTARWQIQQIHRTSFAGLGA